MQLGYDLHYDELFRACFTTPLSHKHVRQFSFVQKIVDTCGNSYDTLTKQLPLAYAEQFMDSSFQLADINILYIYTKYVDLSFCSSPFLRLSSSRVRLSTKVQLR